MTLDYLSATGDGTDPTFGAFGDGSQDPTSDPNYDPTTDPNSAAYDPTLDPNYDPMADPNSPNYDPTTDPNYDPNASGASTAVQTDSLGNTLDASGQATDEFGNPIDTSQQDPTAAEPGVTPQPYDMTAGHGDMIAGIQNFDLSSLGGSSAVDTSAGGDTSSVAPDTNNPPDFMANAIPADQGL